MSHHENLVKGLVGDRYTLYNTSAHFRSAVQSLAQMLPLWIDGIAAQSEVYDSVHAERLRLALQPSPDGFGNHLRLDLTEDARRDVGVTSWRDR